MSQEQPPVRSRRELRQARDEKQATGSTGPGQVPPASKQTPSNQARTPEPAGDAGRVRRVAGGPVDSVPDLTQAQRSSQIRARDRAALRAIKDLEEKEGQLAAGGPPTRRQLRLQQLKEQAITSANPIVPPAPNQAAPEPAQPAASPQASGVPDSISVEQALAARAQIAEQAKDQLAKMEHSASLDPEAVDPEVLAEQIALAERAAVLNRRAIAKQKLAEQAAMPPAPETSPRPEPSAASNLAMVTPLEFVQVPGVDRPVMKPPATSYVPVVTKPGPRLQPSGNPQPSGGKGPTPSTTSRKSGTDPTPAAAGRSRVIARAEAAARAAVQQEPAAEPAVPPVAQRPAGQPDDLFDDLPRIPARSAYGLEPLDAATAGLARAKRMRLVQFGVLAFGIVALVSGVILIISGMSR